MTCDIFVTVAICFYEDRYKILVKLACLLHIMHYWDRVMKSIMTKIICYSGNVNEVVDIRGIVCLLPRALSMLSYSLAWSLDTVHCHLVTCYMNYNTEVDFVTNVLYLSYITD